MASSSDQATDESLQLNSIFDAFLSNVSRRFDFLHIGPLCNGSRSFSFSDAFCDLESIEVPGCPLSFRLSVYMNILFHRAFCILEAQKSNKDISMSTEETLALRDLQNYLLKIETHSKSILKVGEQMKKEPSKETILSATLAEHLITPLASRYTYSMDARAQGKGQNLICRCGCTRPIHYGVTGIGHHKVWHGFVDIVIKEKKDEMEAVGAAKVVTEADMERDEGSIRGVAFSEIMKQEEPFEPTSAKRQKVQDDNGESLNLSSLSGDSISEVKLKINRHVEDQTVAQAIVFALLQKQQYPNTNIFVPNILICDTKFYIVMYEPVKDILVWSGEFHLWDQSSQTTLNTTAVITLWMVIHYKLFCSGGEIFENLSEVKAGFFDQISEEKKNFYEHLHFGVTNFETDTKELGFTSRSHQMSDSFKLAKINLKRQRTI